MDIRTALLTILDHADYTAGNCGPTEMVAAILPREIMNLAKDALDDDLVKQEVFCTWFEEEGEGYGPWDTACNNKYYFGDVSPKDDEFKFCPYCGKRIMQGIYRGEDYQRFESRDIG